MKFAPLSKLRTAFRKAMLNTVATGRGWYRLLEADVGNWQSDIVVDRDGVLANATVFACMTLIARDIAKLRVKLVQKQGRVWQEVTNPAYSPVLRKPNHFQTRNQFFEHWMLSKLATGNTYVLKHRHSSGVVKALYVLDPNCVMPLVSDTGDVFYSLSQDHLSGTTEQVTVPASEIVHDRWNCVFHPLVGLSPIFANGVAAMQGLKIQQNATHFFANQSQPGGILVAPGEISEDTAKELKEAFDKNFTGKNAGKIAVVGDGLTFQSLGVSAKDSQMVEQLKWTAEIIAATFHVPLYKIGLGTMPTAGNVQSLNIEYFSQALQSLIEEAESCLDEGLGMDGVTMGTEFDVDNLLRMDSATQMEVLDKARSVLTLDERRERLDAAPVTGGDTIYLQQQDHSLEAIAARDAQLIRQSKEPTPAPALPAIEAEEAEKALAAIRKGFAQ